MNESAGTPLPMNSTPSHAKLRLSLSFADRFFIAGDNVCGIMEMECRGGEPGERSKEVGIGSMMIEMWGVEELLSRDHTAKTPFLYCRRLFQGPGLPPSNAVHAHPLPNQQPLPAHYHLAKRGQSSFNFRLPVPATSPSSISFCQAARVRYELRASVHVFWKGEKKVVVQSKEVDVVESYADVDFGRDEPEAIAVGENGKIWMQGKLIGGVLVAGETACIELQVKNHSTRKNTSLSLALTRTLHINNAPDGLSISDTLTTVPFRGQEYIIPPGAEGAASLVFDVPRMAKSVKGGKLEGLEEKGAIGTQALFEIRAGVSVKMGMGVGRSDIIVNIPVIIVHPAVLPELPPEPYTPQQYYDSTAVNSYDAQIAYRPTSPYSQVPYPPMSPPLAYVDPNQHYIWLPPPTQTYIPPPSNQPGYYPHPPQVYSSDPAQIQQQTYVTQTQPPRLLRLPLASGLPAPSLPTAVPLIPSSPSSAPLRIDLHNLTPLDLSTQPQAFSASGVVHSPRPFLSPKLSPSIDPMNNSLGRSERVEELERMADEVENTILKPTEDEAEPMPVPTTRNKTLPSPPVPSGKVSVAESRPRVDEYFAIATVHPQLAPQPSPRPSPRTSTHASPRTSPKSRYVEGARPHSKEPSPTNFAIPNDTRAADDITGMQTPPTPTLTGISRLAAKKSAAALSVPPVPSLESGLDALERRLLAEVGTRKMKRDDTPPSIMGLGFGGNGSKAIDIPSPRSKDSKEEGDSAISSLSLGAEDEEKEWDERTHRGGARSKVSHDGGKSDTETTKAKSEGQGRKNGEKRDGKSKRKIEQAKGRVAAWLGGVAGSGADNEGAVSGPPTSRIDDNSWEIPAAPKEEELQKTAEAPVSPPIAISQAEEAKSEPEESFAEPQPNPRSSGFMPIGTFKRDAYTRTLVHKDANPWTDEGSPKSAKIPPPEATNPWKQKGKSPKVLKFPPQPRDAEVNYDIRSARGGRGGKVTAVAAIWASANENPTSLPISAKATTTSPKPLNLYKLGKSPTMSSVAVSSSHATPIISSTASLARPVVASEGWKPAMTTLAETSTSSPNLKSVTGDIGKKKIKDLIKKYQQQPTT